jgi:hypothetical protein
MIKNRQSRMLSFFGRGSGGGHLIVINASFNWNRHDLKNSRMNRL